MPYRVKKINSEEKLQKFYRKWRHKKKKPSVILQLDGLQVENHRILCRVAKSAKVKRATIKNVFARGNGLHEFLRALEENSSSKSITLDISRDELEHCCSDAIIALIMNQKIRSLTLPAHVDGDAEKILAAITEDATELGYHISVKNQTIRIKHTEGFWRRVTKLWPLPPCSLNIRNAHELPEATTDFNADPAALPSYDEVQTSDCSSTLSMEAADDISESVSDSTIASSSCVGNDPPSLVRGKFTVTQTEEELFECEFGGNENGAAMRSILPSYSEAVVRNCERSRSMDAGLNVLSRLPDYGEAVMSNRFRCEKSIYSDEGSADPPDGDTNCCGLNTGAISDDSTEARDDTTDLHCGVTAQAEGGQGPFPLGDTTKRSPEQESGANVKVVYPPRSKFDSSSFLHENNMNSSVVSTIADQNAVEQECATTHPGLDTARSKFDSSSFLHESNMNSSVVSTIADQNAVEQDCATTILDETADEKNEQTISKFNLPTKDLNNMNASICNLHPGEEAVENIGKLISSSALQSQQVFKSPFSADISPDGGEIPLIDFRLNIPKGCFKSITKVEGILEIDPSKNPKGYIPITPLLFLKDQHPLKPFSAKITSQCINLDSEKVKNTTVHVLHLPDGKIKWDVIDSLPCGHEAEIQIERIDCGPIMFAMREGLAETQKFVIQCSLYADSDNNFTFLFHLKSDLSDNEFSVTRLPGESRFNFNDISAEQDDTIRAEITSAENVTFEHNGVGEFRVDEQFLTQKWWEFKTFVQNERSVPDGKLTITGRIFLNNMASQERGRFRYTLKSHSGRFTEHNIDIRRLEGNVAFNPENVTFN